MSDGASVHERIIEPDRGGWLVDARELWESRELLYLLVWRDLKVRYKQTMLGVSWIVLQAALATSIFSMFFGRLSPRTFDAALPYPVFTLAGIVPWLLFANGVTAGTTSLVANEALVRRVYFPRYLIPLSAVLTGLVDSAIGLALLMGLALASGIAPSVTWLCLPFVMILCAATTASIAAPLAALNVRFRDVQHVTPFFTQIFLFLSPVVYGVGLVAEPWRAAYALNPLVGIMQAMRWAIAGGDVPPAVELGLTIAVTLALLIGGSALFRKMERKLADVI